MVWFGNEGRGGGTRLLRPFCRADVVGRSAEGIALFLPAVVGLAEFLCDCPSSSIDACCVRRIAASSRAFSFKRSNRAWRGTIQPRPTLTPGRSPLVSRAAAVSLSQAKSSAKSSTVRISASTRFMAVGLQCMFGNIEELQMALPRHEGNRPAIAQHEAEATFLFPLRGAVFHAVGDAGPAHQTTARQIFI